MMSAGVSLGAPTPVQKLDDELLAELIRQPLSYQACHDVGGTTGGKSDNDAHGPGRIGLSPSDA